MPHGNDSTGGTVNPSYNGLPMCDHSHHCMHCMHTCPVCGVRYCCRCHLETYGWPYWQVDEPYRITYTCEHGPH